jgi:hypothetical protein
MHASSRHDRDRCEGCGGDRRVVVIILVIEIVGIILIIKIGTIGDDEGWERLCSPLRFVATIRNRDQRAWGLLVRVKTPDGGWNQQAIPRELIAGSGRELRKILIDLGAIIRRHFSISTEPQGHWKVGRARWLH